MFFTRSAVGSQDPYSLSSSSSLGERIRDPAVKSLSTDPSTRDRTACSAAKSQGQVRGTGDMPRGKLLG